MRVSLLVTALAAALSFVSPASAQPSGPSLPSLPWRSLLDWQPDKGSVTYTYDSLRLTIAPSDAPKPQDRVAVVTITQPGMQPVTLRGLPGISYRFGIGRVDERVKQPAVLLETFTGGAHCCSVIDVAVPTGDHYQVVRLRRPIGNGKRTGLFDATIDEFPIDISGDGIADFVLTDDTFLYRFSSYAGSMPPPLVLNIRDGKSIDVSAMPGLRPLFEMKMAEARAACTAPASQDVERNGACAGYVADAARVGQFGRAWKDMLAHYDPHSTWNKAAFVPDLKDFLRKNGYIR